MTSTLSTPGPATLALVPAAPGLRFTIPSEDCHEFYSSDYSDLVRAEVTAWLRILQRVHGAQRNRTATMRSEARIAGKTYVAVSAKYYAIERTTAGDREVLQIRSWRFDGSPFAAFQPFAPQYDLFVEVLEVDLGGGQPEIATLVFSGLLETVEPTGRSLKITCTTRLDRLGTKLPRFYVQSSCNYCVYDANCKVSRAAYSVAATVASADAAGLTFVLAADGLMGLAANWFQFGDAEITDADGLPQYRTCVSSAPAGGNQQAVVLNAPFAATPAVGATVIVAKGCNLQYNSDAGCRGFGNKINFGGHPYIEQNLTLKTIPMDGNGSGKGGGK